jgi:putative two-component system response regulator
MAVTTTGRVLIAGDADQVNQVIEMLKQLGWSATAAITGGELIRTLRQDTGIDLALLCATGEVDRYLELCRDIKFDRRTSFVPVIVLHSMREVYRGADAFEAGADDYMALESPPREMHARLQRVVRYKQATDSLEDSETVITVLAGAIEGKDEYTCGHVERVSSYSVEIGQRLGIDPARLAALRTGGVVHDIGKVCIPEHILNKQGKLTTEEFVTMQRHPAIGYDILKPLRTFRTVLPIVRWHHERPNGKGYPDGLRDDELPLLPRIVSVADVFDALSTDRPYRKAMGFEQYRAILVSDGETGNLDPKIVKVLLEILEPQVVGAR